MIVTCEACFTSFNLNDELIKPSGTKVQCSKCHKVFKVHPFDPEESSSPPRSELSDKFSDLSLSPPLFEFPALDEPGLGPREHSPGTFSLPEDFKDIAEFDFSELDKLLQEDGKDKPENAFSSLEENRPPEQIPSSSEPSEPLDFSETTGELSESDLFDISLDLTEIKEEQDEVSSDFETPVLFETEASDLPTEKTDEPFEEVLSGILREESFDSADDQPSSVHIEAETKSGFSEHEPQGLSIDDFEKTLEMDFSEISLVSTAESQTTSDQKIDIAKAEIESDQTPEDAPISEDTLIGFNDIETLDLSDIEGLIEKQDISESALNEGAENFQRADALIVPLPTSPTDTEKPLEMEDQFLTFDELQLDRDDSKSGTLQEIKESFQPSLSEIAGPTVDISRKPEPDSREPVSDDKEKFISDEADTDEDLQDTRPALKKGISPPILILLILAVIAAVAYGGYLLLNSMGISIPFISQPAPAKVSDPGNLSIKASDINSRFVDNNIIGKLFVITGKVKNEYPMARGSIQIAGKIYTKDKALAKTETVFCGNILSDADLANVDSATLQQRLQNRSGDKGTNQKVLPGTTIPFMIVFSNLPVNLEEFTTEVKSSVVP